MPFARLRRLPRAHRLRWCVACLLLVLLQPFIAAHFCDDGLEDEPMLRLRSMGVTAQFEAPDADDGPSGGRETTVFVQTAAGHGLFSALDAAMAHLLGAALLLLPLWAVAETPVVMTARRQPEAVAPRSGAPPASTPWRRLPPMTAPPLST